MKKIIYFASLLMLMTVSVFSQKTSVSEPPISSDDKITITANINPICSGTKVLYTAYYPEKLTNYQWTLNQVKVPGATNSTYKLIPNNNDVISVSGYKPNTVKIQSDNYIISVVNKVPVGVSLNMSGISVIQGTPLTLVAYPVNGGGAPIFQWKINGANVGTNSNTYVFTPTVTCTVTCTVTSNLTCTVNNPATSSEITITVIQNPSLVISASQNPFCPGYPITFTATPSNTTNPTYQWKVNNANVAGATNSTYTYAPATGNKVLCVMNGSVNSNIITMTYAPTYSISGTIYSTAVRVLPNTSVTFNAVPGAGNGGTITSYQWKVNNVNVAGATNSTYTYVPLDNDNIRCQIGSNATGCVYGNPAQSNTIVMTVTTVTNACPGTPSVVYEGKTYPTVQVGTQCWLGKNLNVGTKIDVTKDQTKNGIIEKYCQGGLESNCDIYGGLYNWGETVNYLNGANNTTNWNPVPTGPVQGLCPNGWHVPTLTEWDILVAYLGQATAGAKMKEPSYNHWNAPNKDANNITNWTGLGSGNRWPSGTYNNFKTYETYWTVTAGTTNVNTDVFYGGLSFSIPNPTRGESYKNNSSSIRCIKNQ
jgi:uncharacterized protein (TIGR02145 family)